MPCRLRVLLALYAVVAVTGALAQNAQTVLPLDDPSIAGLKSLLLEQGMEPLSSAGPFTVDEARMMLARVDPATLSPAGRHAYDLLAEQLKVEASDDPMSLRASVQPRASLEAYLHTNSDPAGVGWHYAYADREPLFELPIEAWIGNGIFTAFDAGLKQNHDGTDTALVPDNYLNWTLDFNVLDYEIPQRAFIASGGPHWSFVMGRDRFSWGNGESGNLLVSDTPDFNDFARLTAYWDAFKYTALWISMVYGLDPNYRWPLWGPTGNLTVKPDYPRNLFLHRLDFQFFGRLSVSVSEGMLAGGVPPDLVYFNPLMIFHDIFRWGHASSILGLEIGYNPWKYLEIYGQAAYNQIQTPFELFRYGTGAAETPNAAAYLGGLRSRVPLGLGYLDAGIEGVFVGPWMYLRENRLISYEWWRWMNSNVPGSHQWVSSSLGYFTGPDALVFTAWAGYTILPGIDVSLDYKRVAQGEQTFATTYAEDAAAIALKTPSGTPEYRNVLHACVSLEPLSFLKLSTDVAWIVVDNLGHVEGKRATDFQAAFTVSLHASF